MEELNEIQKQFDELMAKAEEILKKNKEGRERWRAEKRGEYWFSSSDFRALHDAEYGTEIDSRRWGARNYFQTEEEAEKVAQHFKDYLTLKADAKWFEPKDNSLDDSYYYVFCDVLDKCLKPYNDSNSLSGVIYFETREDAEASIAKHGDIWKRYLGAGE